MDVRLTLSGHTLLRSARPDRTGDIRLGEQDLTERGDIIFPQLVKV